MLFIKASIHKNFSKQNYSTINDTIDHNNQSPSPQPFYEIFVIFILILLWLSFGICVALLCYNLPTCVVF